MYLFSTLEVPYAPYLTLDVISGGAVNATIASPSADGGSPIVNYKVYNKILTPIYLISTLFLVARMGY